MTIREKIPRNLEQSLLVGFVAKLNHVFDDEAALLQRMVATILKHRQGKEDDELEVSLAGVELFTQLLESKKAEVVAWAEAVYSQISHDTPIEISGDAKLSRRDTDVHRAMNGDTHDTHDANIRTVD